MVDLSRRDVLKIGGGIAVFTGATGGALTLLQGSAAGQISVNMSISLSDSAQEGVQTPDGQLESLELDMTRYDITYSNLTITDQENASMEVTIDLDVSDQSSENLITQNIHTESFSIDKPGDGSVIDVLRDGERVEPFNILSIVESQSEGEFFNIPDGQEKTYTITVSTAVQTQGIDMNSLDEENTVLNEVSNVDLTIQNVGGEVSTEITGIIDAE